MLPKHKELIGKSTIIYLPPTPPPSPPLRPSIEEMADCYTEHEHTKEPRLEESYNEEEDDSCMDTTSIENTTKKRKADEQMHHQAQRRSMTSTKDHPFIRTLREILDNPGRQISAPPILFDFSIEAAKRNWETIINFGGLDELIKNSPFSPLSYGSEFKESRILEAIFHDHPLWPRFKSILDQGSIFPLSEPPPEEIRLRDYDAMLSYKNHKSAVFNVNTLNDHIQKEVEKGWLIPLRPCDAKQLKNASIAPMGVVSQSTINERGK
jgi:hypothetical protein